MPCYVALFRGINVGKARRIAMADLRKLLEAKLAGEEIAKPEPVTEAPVVDLMEALKKSVAASKKRDGTKPAARKKTAPRKRAAAK